MGDMDRLFIEGGPYVRIGEYEAEAYNAAAGRLQMMAQDAYPNLIWRCHGVEAGVLDAIAADDVVRNLLRIEARITVAGWNPLCCMTRMSIELAKDPLMARTVYQAVAERLVNALSDVLLGNEGLGKGVIGKTVVAMEEPL